MRQCLLKIRYALWCDLRKLRSSVSRFVKFLGWGEQAWVILQPSRCRFSIRVKSAMYHFSIRQRLQQPRISKLLELLPVHCGVG